MGWVRIRPGEVTALDDSSKIREFEFPPGKMTALVDSGERREFESGAVRDMARKGRCDLLPLDVAARMLGRNTGIVMADICAYQSTGDTKHLFRALEAFAREHYGYGNAKEHYGSATALLEVAFHYEDGAEKYTDRNWQKGIPCSCFIDSAVRHLIKFERGDDDERHDRAFVWNVMGCVWTHEHKPELRIPDEDMRLLRADEDGSL
jgi:hypothetical protein